MKRARILLGDDHSLIVGGIRALLSDHYDVAGSADNGRALVESVLRLAPNLVVLDVSMPVLNGIEAASEIRKAMPAVKLVFLSMHANPIYVRQAMAAGASAYVLKSGAAEELLEAIDTAMNGGSYISPALDMADSAGIWPEDSGAATIDLTVRQRQILRLIAEGRQNKEIADVLHVSVKTVEFHRGRLMAKLGARTAADLTRFAIQEGFIVGAE